MSATAIKKTLVALLFIIVIGTPLFYFRWGVYPYTLAKELFFQAAVEILFFLWLALAIIDKKYRPGKSPLLISLIVFLAVLTTAAILGVDPARSLWSTYERAIGVVAIYHFAAFALVISCLWKEIPWRKLFYASLGTALFIDLLAWLQLGNQNLLLVETPGNRPGATFGNPTFFSDYLLFNIFIALYFLFDYWRESHPGAGMRGGDNRAKNVFIPIFLFTALAADLAALFLAQTRGDILGLGVGCLVLLFVFAFRPPELMSSLLRSRRFYAIVLAVVIVGGASFWITRENNIWDSVPGLSRFKNLSFSFSASDRDFGPRLIALHAAWEGFLERPVLGWGPENFNIVFNKFYDPRALEVSYQETRFDKPHNFVMESLISGGALLALAYFAVFGFIMYEAARLKDRFWIVIIPLVSAYIISDLFVFETTGGLLMLYMVIGFVDGKYKDENKTENNPQEQNHDRKQGFMGKLRQGGKTNIVFPFLIAGMICAYFVNVTSLYASYNQFLGFSYVSSGKQKTGIEYFKKASAATTPYKWNFERDFGAEVAQIYFYNPGYISEQDVLLGVSAFEDARDAHPLDAYNHYALVDIYNEVSALDPQKYLCASEREARIALELSPDRQEVYFSLAKTKSLEGTAGLTECDGVAIGGGVGNEAALAALKTAIDLDPKVPDGHFYYGVVAFAIGNSSNAYDLPRMTVGYNEIKTAISLGRVWKTYYEPRIVADDFADFADATRDQKYLKEAIDLYKTALVMQEGDTETEIKLGLAYFRNGDIENARVNLAEAAKKFDFTKSPSYGALKPILDSLGIR